MKQTDVDQILTAEVGLKATRGEECLHWQWGRVRAGWRTRPPKYVHRLGWVRMTIPLFRMLPRQVLPASWEGEEGGGKPPECLSPHFSL